MSSMVSTPSANRIHIAFFGLRNAGKSTLVNAFCGQSVAIVSATPGTTTDPVSKAMEILPLGPCLVTDTAGLDDEGALGAERVQRTLQVLASTDIAVWVHGEGAADATSPFYADFRRECERRAIEVIEYGRGEDVGQLKRRIAEVKLEAEPGLLEGLVGAGDRVLLVCPIDAAAPKGRLILPQVQVLRECLDRHAIAQVCQVAELSAALEQSPAPALVITDSQVFKEVRNTVDESLAIAARRGLRALPCGVAGGNEHLRLTSFSVLFARQKGDFAEFCRGVEAVKKLRDGDRVLVAEACTHHRQCNDIGTTKIPRAITKLSGGKRLDFSFVSGRDFLSAALAPRPSLIVHCGGCMLTRRMLLARIAQTKASSIPIVNYGIILAAAAGIDPAALKIER